MWGAAAALNTSRIPHVSMSITAFKSLSYTGDSLCDNYVVSVKPWSQMSLTLIIRLFKKFSASSIELKTVVSPYWIISVNRMSDKENQTSKICDLFISVIHVFLCFLFSSFRAWIVLSDGIFVHVQNLEWVPPNKEAGWVHWHTHNLLWCCCPVPAQFTIVVLMNWISHMFWLLLVSFTLILSNTCSLLAWLCMLTGH